MTLDERLSKARDLRKAGKHAEALVIAEEAVRLEPTSADAWWILGLASHSLGKLTVSLDALRKTAKLAPRFASAFAQYGVVLAQSGQVDEGIQALDQALRIDPALTFALRQAARICGEAKNEEGRIKYLERLAASGEADAHDLNTLGIAHWNLKHFFHAIEYYRQSASLDPSPAAHFNLGLVFNHDEVSQDIDAIDAFNRALALKPDYEPALKKVSALAPRLETLAENVLKLGDTLIPEEDWFHIYVNPFELLRVETDSLEELDAKMLKRLKRELLQEITLEDGRLSWMEGYTIDQSRAIGLCEELNDGAKRENHWRVFRDKPLLRFLTRGEHRLFLYDRSYTSFETLTALDSSTHFREWLSEPFARQYDRVLSAALETPSVDTVEALFDGRRWVLPEHDELCFGGIYAKAKEMLAPLNQLAAESKNEAIAFARIEKALKQRKLIEIFNLLPAHFREVQSEAVSLVRRIAIDAYNQHGDAEISRTILHLSKKFAFKSAELTAKLNEDFEQIEKLIQEERKHEAKLTSGKVAWEVTKTGVRQGDKFLAAASVSSMRWGILISGYQHAPSYEFLMAFRDDKQKEVVFSWTASNELEKQQEHFGNLVQAALAYIAPVIIKKITETLEKGGQIKVGSCMLKKEGVVFTTQGWFSNKIHTVPWKQVGTKIQNGGLTVLDRANPKTATVMPLRETENAVALQFFSNANEP